MRGLRRKPTMRQPQPEHRLYRAAGTLLLATAAALLPSCGDDTPTEPTALDVRVAYVSQIVGCPDKENECYPMCAHGAAPAGVRIVPLWQADAIRLSTTTTDGRYEGTLAAVPTNTTLRLYGTDPNTCCINSCSPPPVVEDILLNGTKLTKIVHDGLPSGVTSALEFTVTGSGTVKN
jgi:hypothetical protein